MLPTDRGSEVNLVVDTQHGSMVWIDSAPGPRPLSLGPLLRAPTKIVDVPATYPVIAQASNTRGTVAMDVVIATDGTVSQVRILRSIPMLDDAAVGAMLERRFAPTIINGKPVAVRGLASVSFP